MGRAAALAGVLLAACAGHKAAVRPSELPLIRAARAGDLAALRIALAHGSAPEQRGPGAWSALHHAAARGHHEVVAELLAAGASPRTRTRDGFTPLGIAARAGHEQAMLVLIGAGADPDARDPLNGYTPLEWAVEHGLPLASDALIARQRLQAAAPRAASTPRGGDPMAVYAASTQSLSAAAKAREDRSAAAHEALAEDVEVSYTQALAEPAPAAASLRAPPPLSSPLARAAAAGETEMVRLLLQAGADADAAEPDGTTALMLAAQAGSFEVVELLLAAGASGSARDASGRAAWERASDPRIRERLRPPAARSDPDG